MIFPDNPIMNYIIIILIYVLLIFITEMGAYFWHNIAHEDIVPGVHETHKIHHNADLRHEAHEDFFWVILLLIVLGISLTGLWYYDYLFVNPKLVILGYGIIVSVFVWNWYVHSAYHIPDHWLNNYEWFRIDKKIHLQHHVNPWVNYGIASHFSDVIFGTYEYPKEDPTMVFNRTHTFP